MPEWGVEVEAAIFRSMECTRRRGQYSAGLLAYCAAPRVKDKREGEESKVQQSLYYGVAMASALCSVLSIPRCLSGGVDDVSELHTIIESARTGLLAAEQ